MLQLSKSKAELWHLQGWGYTELGWDHWFPSVSSLGPPLPGGWTGAPRDTLQQFWLDVQFTAWTFPPEPMGEHGIPLGSSGKRLGISQLLGGCGIGCKVSVLDDGKPPWQPVTRATTTPTLDGKCWYVASSGVLVGPSFFLQFVAMLHTRMFQTVALYNFINMFLTFFWPIHWVTSEGYGILRWLECQARTGLWQCVRFPILNTWITILQVSTIPHHIFRCLVIAKLRPWMGFLNRKITHAMKVQIQQRAEVEKKEMVKTNISKSSQKKSVSLSSFTFDHLKKKLYMGRCHWSNGITYPSFESIYI